MQARIIAALVLCVIVMMNGSLWAQEETELAKKTQNPIADLISVPLQSNFNFGHMLSQHLGSEGSFGSVGRAYGLAEEASTH